MYLAKNILVLATLCAAWLSPGAAAAQDQPRFSVMGVVIRQDVSIAWIGEPTYTKDNFVRVREGDRVGPYQIVKIREDRVELTGPAGPIVVRLSASAPDVGPQPSGQAVSTVSAPAAMSPAEAQIFAEKRAAGQARVEEFKARYPSQGFNRLLQGNKVQGSR